MKPNELLEPHRSRVLESLLPSQHDWEIEPDELFEALLSDRGIYGYGRNIEADYRFSHSSIWQLWFTDRSYTDRLLSVHWTEQGAKDAMNQHGDVLNCTILKVEVQP